MAELRTSNPDGDTLLFFISKGITSLTDLRFDFYGNFIPDGWVLRSEQSTPGWKRMLTYEKEGE